MRPACHRARALEASVKMASMSPPAARSVSAAAVARYGALTIFVPVRCSSNSLMMRCRAVAVP